MQPIPQQRVIEKMDEYMSRRDYAGAERHLRYWLEEARAADDGRGELLVRNELVGHFRKTGNKEQALEHGRKAVKLVEELGFGNTISAGTTYTNVGTACNAFGEDERALELFQKAAKLYEASPHTAPQLLGGLYNNMALACIALGRFDEADNLYAHALEIMNDVEHGQLEQAITHLNMADAVHARARAELRESPNPQTPDLADVALLDGYAPYEETIDAHLNAAAQLLDTPTIPRDGYYAFVCEKCAPSFAHYGYFLTSKDLQQRAESLYERASDERA